MNISEKFHKLENAIKEYRGTYHPKSKKWLHPPKLSARHGIAKWCSVLGIDTTQAMAAIDGFKTFQEMRTWLLQQENIIIA